MRPLLLALLLTLGSFAAYGQSPDCQFTQTFTATGYGVTVSNQAVANLGTQCTTWRLSYYADGMTALSIQIEGAPDANGSAGTFAAVPTTACSSTVQPPCTLDGANPLTNANHATEAFRGYYAWIALDVTIFTPTGSSGLIVARMYGYKGTSPAAGNRGGSGSGNATTINGASVPASAHALGSNASSQLVPATATDLSATVYVAGGGNAQAQTATLAPAVTALTNGLAVCWLPVAANTAAAPTLTVNATAAEPITKLGTTALVANDLTTTAVACAIYDGTEFQLQNPQTISSGGPFVPYSGATGSVALGVHGITGAAFTGDSGSGGTSGLVPAPASGDAAAGKYLAAGGGWSAPPSGGITALTGDVTASGSGSVAATIGAARVAPAMMKASTLDSQVDSGTVTWAIGSILNAQATLTFTVHTGSRTLNITNPVVGGNYVLKLIQDATGGVGLILGTGCTWKVVNGGAGVVTLTNAPNALDVLTFIYDGTNCLTTLLYNLS